MSASPQKILRTPRKSNILRKAEASDLQRYSSSSTSDVDSDTTLNELQPDDLEDPWPYTFKSGDPVWIRTVGGNWHAGKVYGQTRKGQTRQKEGLFYPVIFCDKIRKHFAPLNGEIKPDSQHVRNLLKDAGWL